MKNNFLLQTHTLELTPVAVPDEAIDYIAKKESLWTQLLAEHTLKNIPLWNGTVYCISNIEELPQKALLYMNTCEYKDILMRETYTIKDILEKYGESYVRPYCNVQCLIKDKNDNFIFGTQINGIRKKLIMVGGTLRKENFEIKSLDDIKRYMLDELNVETNLKIIVENIRYVGILVNNNIATFLFIYNLDDVIFDTNQNFLKRGEFHGEYFAPLKDILSNQNLDLHERFVSIMPLLKEIIL